MAEILVEVRPKPGEAGDLAPQITLTEMLSKRIDDVGDSLREIAMKLSQRLDDYDAKPKKNWRLGEVEIKFSLDLEAEAGVIITRTSASAGFEATLSWRRTASDEDS